MAKTVRQATARWLARCGLLRGGEGFMSVPQFIRSKRLLIENTALGHPIKIANNPLAVKRES